MSIREPSSTVNPSSLKPFHGYQSSLLPLTSGHYIYLASWDSTPTQFKEFSNLWLITPEDKRLLFVDPLEASEIVCIYHEFQEIYGASIQLNWTGDDQLRVVCESDDARYRLTATLLVQQTFWSRLLLAIGAGPPSPFRLSSPVIRISNYLVNLFVARGGSTLLGRTETNQPFYHGETENLYLVKGGTAALNGQDLGSFTVATWPVEFGDAVPFKQPVFKIGTLYIPF
jgi:hypothetical protein